MVVGCRHVFCRACIEDVIARATVPAHNGASGTALIRSVSFIRLLSGGWSGAVDSLSELSCFLIFFDPTPPKGWWLATVPPQTRKPSTHNHNAFWSVGGPLRH